MTALNFVARVHHVKVTTASQKRLVKNAVYAAGPTGKPTGPAVSYPQYEWDVWDNIEVLFQILTPSRSLRELGAPHSYGQVTQGVSVKAGAQHPFRDLVPGQCYAWNVTDHALVKEDI